MDGLGVFERMNELARSGQAFALATVVWRQGPSSSKQGSRAIITSDGQLHGWIGGACAEPVVIREAQQIMADGHPKLLLLGDPDQFGSVVPDGMTVVPISCQSEGALQVYIEPVLPVPHLVIVGRSPMAQTLAEQARALGWLTDLLTQDEFTAGGQCWRRRAVDGGGRDPGPRRRGHDRARGGPAPGLPGPGRVPPPGRGRARLPGRAGGTPGPAGPGARTGRAGPGPDHP